MKAQSKSNQNIEHAELIKEILGNVLENMPIDKVEPSPMPGVMQAFSGTRIIYISDDGRYLIGGDMLDLQEKNTNLSEKMRKGLRKDFLKSLDKSKFITFAPKNPKYNITVFTDVDCGYSKKFHSEIKEYNAEGIAVHYAAYPRSGKDTESYYKMVHVWCSENQHQAMDEAKVMLDPEAQAKAQENDVDPEYKSCEDHMIAEQFDFAMKAGLGGTPAILLDDGTLFPGYMPPKMLVEKLKEHYSK